LEDRFKRATPAFPSVEGVFVKRVKVPPGSWFLPWGFGCPAIYMAEREGFGGEMR